MNSPTRLNFSRPRPRSMAGPFALAGSEPRRLGSEDRLSPRRQGTDGPRVDVALEVADGRLSYKGDAQRTRTRPRLSGKVSASADNLVLFVKTLARIAGQPDSHVPPLLAGKFRFEGPVELSRTAVTAKDFTLVLDETTRVSGSFAATVEPALTVDARFSRHPTDLDRWLKTVVLPAELRPRSCRTPLPPERTAPSPRPRAGWPPSPPSSRWRSARRSTTSSPFATSRWNSKPGRRGRGAEVRRHAAGRSCREGSRRPMSDTSARPGVSGDFSLEGPKLRETLAWLKVDTAAVPADKLTRVSLHGKMGSRDGNVQVDDAVFELDDLGERPASPSPSPSRCRSDCSSSSARSISIPSSVPDRAGRASTSSHGPRRRANPGPSRRRRSASNSRSRGSTTAARYVWASISISRDRPARCG